MHHSLLTLFRRWESIRLGRLRRSRDGRCLQRSGASPGQRHDLALRRPNMSGTVARSHSSLDRLRFELTGVCRFRNDAADMLRELLKSSSELQPLHSGSSSFLSHLQAVRSANLPIDRSSTALPGADCVRCLWIARACRAQDVDPAPIPSSERRSLRPADRLGPAGHPGARRLRRRIEPSTFIASRASMCAIGTWL